MNFRLGSLRKGWTEAWTTASLSECFPDILDSWNPTQSSDSDPRSFIAFNGNGYDPYHKRFQFHGRLYPLDSEKTKIPGCQRLVMFQFFGRYDEFWCWEACILPGGSIMIGRYYGGRPWAEQDGRDCGPLIMWLFQPYRIAAASSKAG
jgi:hypothetical protein